MQESFNRTKKVLHNKYLTKNSRRKICGSPISPKGFLTYETNYLFAIAALICSVNNGTTLLRSPTIP